MVAFDNAGNFLKAWGGAGSGYEWPEREHGIHVDNKGMAWITGNNCPTNGIAGLKKVADECAARNLRVAGGPECFRISTGIFTQPTDLDLFYDALYAGMRT